MKKKTILIALVAVLTLISTACYMKPTEPVVEPTIAETEETTETPTEIIPAADESVESAPSTEVTEEVPSTEEVTEQQTEAATTEEVPVVEETVAENEVQPSSEVSSEQANSNLTSQTNGETVQGELFPGINPEDVNPGAIGHHIMPTEEEKKAAEEASGYKPPESAVGKTAEEALKDKDAQTAKDKAEDLSFVEGDLKWNSDEGGWEADLKDNPIADKVIVTPGGGLIFD